MNHFKTCFKCIGFLPLTDFYRHDGMADGHLNKCKRCTKADVAARVSRLSSNPAWVESEMERHRIKQRKARAEGRAAPASYEAKERYRKKHPERARARTATFRAIHSGKLKRQPCEVCGAKAEAHHEDYSKPLDVRWLCDPHHKARHVEIRREARAKKYNNPNLPQCSC